MPGKGRVDSGAMDSRPIRVLVVAEAANPEWVSVPLVGWSHAHALSKIVDAHLCTQWRNKAAIERAGWQEGREFTSINTESSAAPLYRFTEWVRKATGLGWSFETALGSLGYYHFEYALTRRFGRRIDAGEFDVVHRITPLTPTAPSPFLASRCEKAKVPFVWGPINGGVPWPKEFQDVQHAEGEWLSKLRGAYKWLPGARQARVLSKALIAGSQSVWSELAGYHDHCVYVPENAVDPARFNLRAKPYAGGPVRVAFVGRLVPYKGADMLIEATAPLVKAGKLIVEILGDGPEMPRLKAMVAERGLESGILLPGWVPHEALQGRLAEAQVFGFPSVREFGGGVVLEAMALGLVPVIVGYAGPDELVTPASGFRIPLASREGIIQAFRECLAGIVEKPGVLGALSDQARKRALSLFTWEAKAAQTKAIYEWVLGRRGKPDFGMPFRDLPDPA